MGESDVKEMNVGLWPRILCVCVCGGKNYLFIYYS
jgi:hypothetical protein